MSGFWNGRRVLITGAAGFLGSHLTDRLLKAEAAVTASSRDGRKPLAFGGPGPEPELAALDVTDGEAILKILRDKKIETVFHLAARSIVGEANLDPAPAFETNIKGTWSLLEACRRHGGIGRVIVSSSDKAYGEAETLPYVETMPLKGAHPYDVSKSCADLLATAYFNTYKLPVCITRCGNYFGPGDLHRNRLAPGAIISFLEGRAPVLRGDGQSVRDYLYVEDGALAQMLLAEKMDGPGIAGQAFNFSNGRPVSALEMVTAIGRIMGREDLKPVIQGQGAGEIKAQCLCAEKARKMLGWKPLYPFEEALQETVQWYRRAAGQAGQGPDPTPRGRRACRTASSG